MVSVVRDISHVCGHQDSIRIAENSREKVEKYALWLASKICKECYKLEGRETLNLAAEKLVGIPLPTLRGTDKQIGYATAKRSDSIRYLVRGPNLAVEEVTPRGLEAAARMVAITEAGWWIDNPVPWSIEKRVQFVDRVLAGEFDTKC